jgi:ABC-2 type transport system ATP-binding protein
MSIKVSNLVKIYGEQKAVNNISFEVNKGEIVGFLGPNGAGKSTTMKILTGYLQANSGQAFINDINVITNPIEAKKQIGYLPEANPLYTDMYVKEYLQFTAAAYKQKNEAALNNIIELVGLLPEYRKKIGELSKGYRQRVGLAAALIHNPSVLILDEPTSGLDPNQLIEIRNVIKQAGKNKTVLFSSHIMQEVEAICDRVIIINKGEIVANNTLANLQKSQAGNNIIEVSFKEAITKEKLSQLKNIEQLVQLPNNSYQLHTSKPEAVRKQLMQLAIDNNYNITSLQTVEQKLEEVFRGLTN